MSDYLYYKFNYVNVALEEILRVLQQILDFQNIQDIQIIAEDTVNNFHRFSRTWARKKTFFITNAWNLKSQDKFIELKDLANKPFSNVKLKIKDINKVEEQITTG